MSRGTKGTVYGGGIVVLGLITLALVVLAPGPGDDRPRDHVLDDPILSLVLIPRTISGLQMEDLHKAFSPQGFKLESGQGDEPTTAWVYTNIAHGRERRVSAAGDLPAALQLIRGTFRQLNGGDPIPEARKFLGDVASLPYEGSKPVEARQWVERHVGDDGATTVISGVRFEIKGLQSGRMLIMERAR